jgi:hypothetical protein
VDLSRYLIQWEVTAVEGGGTEGNYKARQLLSGQLDPLRTEPGSSEIVHIPAVQIPTAEHADYWLTLSAVLAGELAWAQAGHEVAWAQFELPGSRDGAGSGAGGTQGSASQLPAVSVAVSGDVATVRGAGFNLAFDQATGRLVKWEAGGDELPVQGAGLQVWRAPTDNDANTWGDQRAAQQWRFCGLDRLQEQLDGLTASALPDGSAEVQVRTAYVAQHDVETLAAQQWHEMMGVTARLLGAELAEKTLQRLCEHAEIDYAFLPGKDQVEKAEALVHLLEQQNGFGAFFSQLQRELTGKLPDELDELVRRFEGLTDQAVRLALRPQPETRFDLLFTYHIDAAGLLTIEQQVVCGGEQPPFLPRMGFVLTLPGTLSELSWYGLGPHDSYADRQLGAKVAIHHSTVAEQYVPYILPQEHGNKSGTRWLRLCSPAGKGIEVWSDQPFDFSASYYTSQDLSVARHTHELTPREEVTLNLDFAQGGLGNGSCGPGVLPHYRLLPGEFKFRVRMRRIG